MPECIALSTEIVEADGVFESSVAATHEIDFINADGDHNLFDMSQGGLAHANDPDVLALNQGDGDIFISIRRGQNRVQKTGGHPARGAATHDDYFAYPVGNVFALTVSYMLPLILPARDAGATKMA